MPKSQRFRYEYVTLISVHDGDTITVEIDLGLETVKRPVTLRLYGINAPEMKTARGPASRDRLLELLTGARIEIDTFKNMRLQDQKEKYGRYLAVITAVRDGHPINVNEAMLSGGYAVPYMDQ